MNERGWYNVPVPSGGLPGGYAGGAARLFAMCARGGSGAVAWIAWWMDGGVRRSAGVCSLGPRLVASTTGSAGVCSLGPRLVAPRG